MYKKEVKNYKASVYVKRQTSVEKRKCRIDLKQQIQEETSSLKRQRDTRSEEESETGDQGESQRETER